MEYQPSALTPAQIHKLSELAAEMSSAKADPSAFLEERLRIIDEALGQMLRVDDKVGIIWMRTLFNPLLARDSAIAIPQFQRLDDNAIACAEQIDEPATLAPLLDERGRNLHKQGYHNDALDFFNRATEQYQASNNDYQALRSYYMTASCHRAVGNVKEAQSVLDYVFSQTDPDDPWLGNPLQVQGWIQRNTGRLDEAEHSFLQALALQRRLDDPDTLRSQLNSSDILVAGTLADLGEVAGLQGRAEEAQDYLYQSLTLLTKYGGQYNRHIARSSLKLAEVLIFDNQHRAAQKLLNEANDRICASNQSTTGAGHYYDVLWRLELLHGLIYIQLGELSKGLRKWRSAWRYRRNLGLTTGLLLQQIFTRLRATLKHQE